MLFYGVMAALVFVNELLSYSCFYFKRVSKRYLCNILSSFYHEDELFAAKTLLCEVADSAGKIVDGWAKLVNNKGGPINRKGEGVSKRILDADDVLSMLAVLDINDVALPTYAAVNLCRLPPSLTPFTSGSTDLSGTTGTSLLSDMAKSLEAVVKRLDALELSTSTMPSVATTTTSVNQQQHVHLSPSPPPPLLPSATASAASTMVDKMSWATTASSGDVSGLISAAKRPNKPWRGSNSSVKCTIKTVPRPLACFVGRLDVNTTRRVCMSISRLRVLKVSYAES